MNSYRNEPPGVVYVERSPATAAEERRRHRWQGAFAGIAASTAFFVAMIPLNRRLLVAQMAAAAPEEAAIVDREFCELPDPTLDVRAWVEAHPDTEFEIRQNHQTWAERRYFDDWGSCQVECYAQPRRLR